ncbi:MAG: hypothetical protein LIP01_10430 [Tannerellaceae bacterium]|nr:hypothetical protein [Tannerellaceae bacterium]
MKLDELRNLSDKLHGKANASSGIPAAEDKNEWMAERIDTIIGEDSYALQDLLDECDTEEQVIQQMKEQYRQLNHCDSHGFNE